MTADRLSPADDALLRRLQEINASAAFNRWAGFEVSGAAEGYTELTLRWREDFGQYAGFLHAGMIGALIDTACGYAAVTLCGPVLASHFNVSCLAPAVGERFLAIGRVTRAGRKQAFTRAELFALSGDVRKCVATGEALLVPVAS